MKNFNVLLTCCSIHVKEVIDCLKNNEDGVDIKVYVAISVAANLPPAELSDGNFVVPPVSAPNYVDTLISLCKEYDVSIIMPTATLELEIMARAKDKFEQNGILVSVSSIDSLLDAINKIALFRCYAGLMPKQIIPESVSDVDAFASMFKYKNSSICCKVDSLCGGKGFAVVDDKKCNDASLFNKFGENRYISLLDLKSIVDNGKNKVILQQRIEGLDYTVSALADKGIVTHICGYVGYMMAFGSIMYGEIQSNDMAYDIVSKIVRELELDGNVAFDFILKKGGKVVLLEINPRINASLPFVRHAGCNMVYLRCKQLLGYEIPSTYELNYGLKMKKFYDTRYYD